MRYAVFCFQVLFSVPTILAFPVGELDARVVAPTRFYAKGWNIARLDLTEGGSTVKSFGLSYSDGGGSFKSLNAGLPRPGELFKSMYLGTNGATLLVSLVGNFQVGADRILFSAPRRVVLRWDVRFAEGDPKYVLIDQPVDIQPPLQADVDFLAQLGDPDLIRAMFGEDFFKRQDSETRAKYAREPEILAVGVIRELLSVTREPDPTRVDLPNGDVRKTADLLWQLAQDLPDSSYAPYTAYYAACCYSAMAFEESREAIRAQTMVKRFATDVAEGEFRASFLKNNDSCSKSFDALTFAGNHGDAYLQPLALFRHAIWRSFIFDLDRCEELLVKAREAAPGRGTIQDKIDKLQNGLPKIRSLLMGAESRDSSDRNK